MDQLRKYFESLIDVTDDDWNIFKSHITFHIYPKKTILIKLNTVEKHLSFIESGFVRFFIPKIDNDLTFNFAFENDFFSAYDSFLTQTPALYEIETLTEVKIWRISYEELQIIYRKTNIGQAIGRIAAENLFLKKKKRELSLLNETAETRYLKLFKEQPRLIQDIPLKYIASFIGVTPQALSRIRKRIIS